MVPEQGDLDSQPGSPACFVTLGNHLPLFGEFNQLRLTICHMGLRDHLPQHQYPSPHPSALVETLTKSSGGPVHRHLGFSK